MDCVVTAIVGHGPAVKEFQLRRADGQPLPPWTPGAHVSLRFAAADGTSFENRYSLVGAAGKADRYRIAVQREADGKGGSRCLHDEVAVGHPVQVAGPFDGFALRPPAASARITLVGGGIGITPLVSMAHALRAQGIPFRLHYLARDAGRLPLLDELRAIAPEAVAVHLSASAGRIDPAAVLGAHEPGHHLYACGPVALMQALADAGARLGWPANALHFESFGARAASADRPLTVTLSLSGMTVEVAPGTSILDALIDAGALVAYDCKRGECGSCYAEVGGGAPIHRDVCLTPAMRAQGMCTCVSWADGPGLTLAL